jgi:acetolactate synthase-1/2/3 large subunit
MIGKEAFQECPTIAITQPCTKKNYMIKSAAEVADIVHEAFFVARKGRPGPVLIDFPRDVQLEEAEFKLAARPTNGSKSIFLESQRKLQHAAMLINEAKQPIIVAGHGVLMSRASSELRQLAERNQIPVTNTLLGLGSFPRSHQLSLGMLGMHGTYWANYAVNEADLVVGIGVRFDDRVVGNPQNFAPKAKLIHIDSDPSQVGRNLRVDAPLIGDAHAVLRALMPLVEECERQPWLQQIDKVRSEHPSPLAPEGGKLPPQYVLTQLNKLVQEDNDVVVVTGVGQHQMWTAQFVSFNRPDSFITSGAQGTMGFELPAAIGTQVARPKATVWSVCGDGGFQMTVQELAVMADERLPIKMVIINNGYLGMVRQWQELFFQNHVKATPITAPDFVKLAEAYGIPAMRVTERHEVETALRKARTNAGPFLVDMVVDGEANVYPMVKPGGAFAETMEDPRWAGLRDMVGD